ncbi:unnamed protein product [Nyctereutes procyonoides]|uniref:(raccoon dog) hypothetical protein n=1 Tax=Nyctereutes procyonoides TaxID=34880 RepID=A0A811YW38_NYCPR|nr:unnamed protein product [Nyctereutes procyonoides]
MEVPRAPRSGARGPAPPPPPHSQAWLLPPLPPLPPLRSPPRALRGRSVHSCGSARAAASFLPVLPAPGRGAGARSRRELSGNPPRGGGPGALTSP